MNRIQSLFQDLRYAGRHPWIKAGLASFALLLMGVVVSIGYGWPAYRERQALIGQIDTQRRAAVDALHTADVMRVYHAAKVAAGALEQKLNAASGQADMVKSLERIATKHHVRIVSQAYEEGKIKNEYSPLYLDISLQANYASLREFLADIHTLPVWVEVQEMNLERSREHPGLIKASLRLLTYRKATNRRLALAP